MPVPPASRYAVAVLALLATSCGNPNGAELSALAKAERLWRDRPFADYRYDYSLSCTFCMKPQMTLEVRGARVRRA
jgi:hypothetical protein